MSHGHSHAHTMHEQTHAQKSMHEYRNYCYLFAVSIVSAGAEFLIALLLAHSVSAQADAIHAVTHVALYALALFVSRQIHIHRMDAHSAHHYREKFLILYVLLVFTGLAWISYTSIVKLFSSEVVVSMFMMLSVSIGLCGNIIALKLLHGISKLHEDAAHRHTAHRWISLDTWRDFAFSVIVLLTSLVAIIVPSVPIRVIDPIISLGAVAWIGWSGIQILRKKTI